MKGGALRQRDQTYVFGTPYGLTLASACFSRRRCTEEGMRIASRYFATVRRAMSMPASRSRSTMVSSDRTSCARRRGAQQVFRWRLFRPCDGGEGGVQIGRASCRERVEREVVGGGVERRMEC